MEDQAQDKRSVIGDPSQGFAVSHDRISKARKIERILCDHLNIAALSGKKVLDVGCGSGHISQYFAQANDVEAVDIVDQRALTSPASFHFTLVKGSELPFADFSFDVVISNHILAYASDQELHMREAFRVLRPGGIAYFATPNRNFPLEPHYKLPFIHYLPNRIFNVIMKVVKLYDGEVKLLSRHRLLKIARQSGFSVVDYTMEIIRHPERFGTGAPSLPALPNWIAHLSPTSVILGQR